MGKSGIFDRVRVQAMRCEFLTENARATGLLRCSHRRFSDSMNALEQDFVTVWDTGVSAFEDEGERHTEMAEMLLRKSSIILAAPLDISAGRELGREQQALQVAKEHVHAGMDAGPYSIEGTLHLGKGADLLQHIYDPGRLFMAVTDAKVHSRKSPEVRFSVPFLLVNRRSVEMAYEISAVGQKAPENEDVPLRHASHAAISAGEAATVLQRSGLFKEADLVRLQNLCAGFCSKGSISRIKHAASSEVFRQGDWGDSIYVVEEGSVVSAVRDRDSERSNGQVDQGGVVGEMAALGRGVRPVTVRTTRCSTLLAVEADAVKSLLEAFPAAASRLLQLIIERNGGIDNRHLSIRGASLL
ncbi:MAG: cyclic nucleotide-binding domain-containing protein [Chloroflexota bacterium]